MRIDLRMQKFQLCILMQQLQAKIFIEQPVEFFRHIIKQTEYMAELIFSRFQYFHLKVTVFKALHLICQFLQPAKQSVQH